jgi:hypothetical protein
VILMSNIQWTDPEIQSRVTPVKAIHIKELRQQVETNQESISSHLSDASTLVTKDGTLQEGLNAEMLGGHKIDDIVLKSGGGDNAVIPGLNSDLVDGWGLASTLDDLGLVLGTETIVSIISALPNKGIALFNVGSGYNVAQYPASTGSLRIFKISDTAVSIEFASGSNGADLWIGNYNGTTFSGWNKIFANASYQPPLNKGGVPEFLAGTDASKPACASTTVGSVYIATDTYKIYRNTGSVWKSIGGQANSVVRGDSTTALVLQVVTADPTTPAVGSMWLRSDLI